MPPNTAPIFEVNLIAGAAVFTNADGTALKTLVEAGGFGTRIDSILCTTDDTVAKTVAFYISNSETDYYIGCVPMQPGTGYGSLASVDAITLLSPTLGYLAIPSGYRLRANCTAAVSSGRIVTVVALGGDY